jgi:hypothetical protein
MRLIQFHCDGDEHFINPDSIKWVRSHKRDVSARITFTDDSEMVVDESLRTTIARINNQELNVAYDCMGEIERVKQKIKNLERNTQPCAI